MGKTSISYGLLHVVKSSLCELERWRENECLLVVPINL